MTSMKDELNGRLPQWKTTLMENTLIGRGSQGRVSKWKSTSLEALQEADDIGWPS